MYEKDTITISEKFLEIYRNFNVSDQRDNMKQLSKEELYLLLDTCVDSHDEDDLMVCLNFSTYSNELKEILRIQSGDDIDNQIIKNLQEKTDNRLSSTRVLENGNLLPNPYTREEVRDLKLNELHIS